MNYETFSRHLREKYATRYHVADQLIDQFKTHPTVQPSYAPVKDLNTRNLIRAQREISFPLVSYLNQFESDAAKSTEKNNEFEPYFNECLLAAARIRNNRRSERDRQICYENLVLTQKLERIKNASKKRERMNTHQLLLAKATDAKESNRLLRQDHPVQPSRSDQNASSATLVSGSDSALSNNADDQATAADVDGTMESSPSRASFLFKQRKIKAINRNNNCTSSRATAYEHLCKIDMTLLRDARPPSSSPTRRHFSICILPRDDPSRATPVATNQAQRGAFTREVLHR